MTLIIEDGTLVTNATSYVTVAEARAYALARGVAMTDADTKLEIYLTKAMDYLEGLRDDYKGSKVSSTQSLQWPRQCVSIDGTAVAITTIPNELKRAQIALAMAVQDGADLTPNTTGEQFVISEKIGPIETKFSEGINTSGVPIIRSVEALLMPLMMRQGLITVERA